MISDIYFFDSPLTKLINEDDVLGKKINKFIQYAERNWLTSNNKQATKSTN